MSRVCLLTVPGLDVRSDWRRVHDRMVDEFPAVSDVLATTMPETLLVVHDGAPDDAWIDLVAGTLQPSLALRGRPDRAATVKRAASLRWGIVSGWW